METIKIKEKNRIDMLKGSLVDKLLLFALPLAASSILQQLFNAADVAVVGKFAGSEALAAVGGTASVISLIINLFVGLSIGANVVIAGYIGQGKNDRIKDAVHTAVLLSLISGIFLAVLGFFVAEPVLKLIDTPTEILDMSVLYLRIYFGGMPFLMLYNFGSAILRSMGDTRRPLYSLAFAGIINIGLNLLLVIVFQMSVAGVAIATVISNLISSTIVIVLLMKEKEPVKLELKKLIINKKDLIHMVKIGAPAGLQSMVFSISNVCIQAAVNGFGTHAVAGSSAAMNAEYMTYFIINGFGQAAVTFTSQNFAAGNYERCKKIFLYSMFLGLIFSGIACGLFILFREPFVGLFTDKLADVEYGVRRMMHITLLGILPCTYEIGGGALRGMGYSMRPAIITIFGTCVLRIIWVYTIFKKIGTFDALMTVYPVTWIVTGVTVIGVYLYTRRKMFNLGVTTEL